MAAPAPSLSMSMRMTVYGISKKFPTIRNITCEQLNNWIEDESKKLVCLDTRPMEEYDVSHISGAIQVDPESEQSLEDLGITGDSTVVCYCSVGYRSSNVAKTLFSKHKQSTGSSDETLDVYNLEGGLFQWANERRGIVNNSGDKVATVHPYSLFWGKLLNYDLRHE
ncbi:uncharacterized protein LOC135339816 isoform X2 [Halichondria panicea]|uniref:uncharacterized protein LOC135339816 isoform X2 n=1 Tax=Halichondria panicea TaxID=6063 RepID=UPI00312BA9EA